jgi:hypothetical protein
MGRHRDGECGCADRDPEAARIAPSPSSLELPCFSAWAQARITGGHVESTDVAIGGTVSTG